MINILSWNCNGIRTKLGELCTTIDSRDLDVICLQEIKQATIKLKGFNTLYTDPNHRCSIIYKQTLPCSPIVHTVLPSLDWCGLNVFTEKGVVSIITVYVPLGKVELSDLQALLNSAHQRVILCGDFNAKHPMWDFHASSPNDGGRRIMRWLDNSDSIVLHNIGATSRTDYAMRSPSNIDLLFSSSNVAPYLGWEFIDRKKKCVIYNKLKWT